MTRTQQTRVLIILLVVLAVSAVYQWGTREQPRTQPLTYTRGMVVSSPVRRGLVATAEGQDPIAVFLARRVERYPGVHRDLFRMHTPQPKPAVPVVTKPVATAVVPVVPQKSPEEIAAENARADLSRFRFLGYLTDKDSSLFLSKDGELFIAKSGDTLLKSYVIKSAGKDFVVLYDTATRVEVRIELTGSGDAKPK